MSKELQVGSSTSQDERCCCDQFSAHDQRCTIDENWIFRSSIKYSFQRIKNCQVWRSIQGVVIKSFNTTAKKILLTLRVMKSARDARVKWV